MKKSRRLSGFTLIEMIIVMALFTMLLLAAFMLYQPVARIFKRTSVSERTYSYTNNIENIIHGQLNDADNVWVYAGNSLTGAGQLTNDQLAERCTAFKNNYYKDMIIGTGANSQEPAEGTIHIMHVLNNGTASFPSGQIVVSDVPFDCAETANISELDIDAAETGATSILPDAYFAANDAGRYTFNYCLGTGTLQSAVGPGGSTDGYRALDIDMNADTLAFNSQNLSMSVVVTGDTVTPSGAAFADVSNYRAFREPCSISSISLPFARLNSVERGHQPRAFHHANPTGTSAFILDTANITIMDSVQYDRYTIDMSVQGRTDPTDVSVDFGSDIYFIYTYEEEFHV